MRKRKRSAFFRCMAVLVLFLAATAAYTAVYILGDDTVAPVISMTADTLEVSVSAADTELMAGVSAMDDRDGDVSADLLIQGVTNLNGDTATITYAAFDAAGNVSKASRTVRFTDYEPPRFDLNAPLVFEANTSMDVLGRVTASDVFDGNVSRQVKAELVSNTTTLAYAGVHQVQFRVTNSMNDTAYITVPVDVLPAGAYNAEVVLKDSLVYIPAGSSFIPRNYLEGLRLPARADVLENLSDMSVRIESDVNTGVPGTYSVRYTVTYTPGTTAYVGYTRLIVVVEG